MWVTAAERALLELTVARLRRRAMALALDEPGRVIAGEELADDPLRLGTLACPLRRCSLQNVDILEMPELHRITSHHRSKRIGSDEPPDVSLSHECIRVVVRREAA